MKKMNKTGWHTTMAGHTAYKPFHHGVWHSLFILIIYVNFHIYYTRSAAVLWPNKFNTTYALQAKACFYTTNNTQIYLHLFFLTTLVSFSFFFYSFNTQLKILDQIQFQVDCLIHRYTNERKKTTPTNNNVNFIPFISHVINVVTTLSSSRFAFFVIKRLKIKSLNYYLCILYILSSEKRERKHTHTPKKYI